MSVQHIIYIPTVLLLGIVLGYVLGQKAALAELTRRKLDRKQ